MFVFGGGLVDAPDEWLCMMWGFDFVFLVFFVEVDFFLQQQATKIKKNCYFFLREPVGNFW